jgi:TetR/AcrR family transcriptional regulator, mexCD-oprJ operon repressor
MPPPQTQARRADARRNIERILDAALDELASDSEASMAAVAQRAGVARATLYVHFPAREALIAAVTERAIAEASETIGAARPEDGEPADALARVLTAAWRALGRYHALVALNTRLGRASDRAMHEPVLRLLRPILERGQARGEFNADVPVDWLLTVVLELVHAASREVTAGGLPADTAERALLTAVLGAVSLSRPPGT